MDQAWAKHDGQLIFLALEPLGCSSARHLFLSVIRDHKVMVR